MKVAVIASVIAVSLVVSSESARAVTTLKTPFILASSSGACLVTNVSTKAITVTVAMLNAAGTALTLAADTCSTGPLAPEQTCTGVAVPEGPAPLGFFCSIGSSSAKIRAAGYGESGDSRVAVPATVK
jgi:hypothetical protein